VVEVARQAGHSPTMSLDTYGHVFDELADAERVSAETLIRRARSNEDVPVLYPPSAEEQDAAEGSDEKSLHTEEALYRTRTDDPFLTMEVLYQLS
jgi:hypothetical protein